MVAIKTRVDCLSTDTRAGRLVVIVIGNARVTMRDATEIPRSIVLGNNVVRLNDAPWGRCIHHRHGHASSEAHCPQAFQ